MGEFADQIRKFAVLAVEHADEVLTEAIEEVGRRLIIRSPVDTSRFRSNWRYSPGAPDITWNAEARNITSVHGIEAIPQPATAFTHFLTSSGPYSTALERGHSKQAPNGMVGLTAMEWEGIVADASRKVVIK